MFVNSMPRYEILSEDAMAVIDRGWRRLVSEIGIEFLLPEAVELLANAGSDRSRTRTASASTPSSSSSRSPRPRASSSSRRATRRNTAHIGGNHMVFAPVYGCPFIREGDTRRDAKMADFENLVKLCQVVRASSTRPAARSASPRTGRWTPATSTWCSRSRPCPTSRTWDRSRAARTPPTRSGWARSCSAGGKRSSARRSRSASSTSTPRSATTTGCSPRCSST